MVFYKRLSIVYWPALHAPNRDLGANSWYGAEPARTARQVGGCRWP